MATFAATHKHRKTLMRIALVNPVARRTEGYHTIGTGHPATGAAGAGPAGGPEPPRRYHRRDFRRREHRGMLSTRGYDLVGVTAFSSGATRAYELAAQCRREGMPCIMGGPHAWAVPDEAAAHFDSVAIGECDEIWPEILADAAAGRLPSRYQGRLADLDARASAARPSTSSRSTASTTSAASRPPAAARSAATIAASPGSTARPSAAATSTTSSTSGTAPSKQFVFVVDDNFFGVGPKPRRVGQGTAPRDHQARQEAALVQPDHHQHGRRRRGAQAGLQGRLPRHAGRLRDLQPRQPQAATTRASTATTSSATQELVDGFHKAGISRFRRLHHRRRPGQRGHRRRHGLQAVKLGIDTIQITNLTPLPGTKMYDRYMAEGRIFATNYPADWERYTFVETVYNPAQDDRAAAGRDHLRVPPGCRHRGLGLAADAAIALADQVPHHGPVRPRDEQGLETDGQDPGPAQRGQVRPARSQRRTEKIHRSFAWNHRNGHGKDLGFGTD